MTPGDGEVRLLLSAGRGPAECAWAVAELLARLSAEAAGAGVGLRRLETVPGDGPGTCRSVLVALTGAGAEELARSWTGTLCWRAPSPYRPGHPRRNWYVLAARQEPEPDPVRSGFRAEDVDLVACRTGGPGGQHRNKASTAVRATHRPSGLVVVVDEERRLSDNRRRALEILRQRLEQVAADAGRAAVAGRREAHDRLVRGDAVRTERPALPR